MEHRRETFGQQVRRLREHQGFTLSELARRSGLSRSYLYQIESGESSPTHEKLEPLANALGVTLADLLGAREERLEIPPSLADFAEEHNLPPADVETLARIQYRGRKPETKDEWRILYNAIRWTLDRET